MTQAEFYPPYERFCARFKLEPNPEQARIWYQRFGQRVGLPVWEAAVDHLVAELRMPLADHVFKAVDEAAAHARRTQLAQDRRTAGPAVKRLQAPDFGQPEALRRVFAYARTKGCGLNEAFDAILPAWTRQHPEDTAAVESWGRIQAYRAEAKRIERDAEQRRLEIQLAKRKPTEPEPVV